VIFRDDGGKRWKNGSYKRKGAIVALAEVVDVGKPATAFSTVQGCDALSLGSRVAMTIGRVECHVSGT